MSALNFEKSPAERARPDNTRDTGVLVPSADELKAVLGKIDLSVVATSVCACGCSCHVENE